MENTGPGTPLQAGVPHKHLEELLLSNKHRTATNIKGNKKNTTINLCGGYGICTGSIVNMVVGWCVIIW